MATRRIRGLGVEGRLPRTLLSAHRVRCFADCKDTRCFVNLSVTSPVVVVFSQTMELCLTSNTCVGSIAMTESPVSRLVCSVQILRNSAGRTAVGFTLQGSPRPSFGAVQYVVAMLNSAPLRVFFLCVLFTDTNFNGSGNEPTCRFESSSQPPATQLQCAQLRLPSAFQAAQKWRVLLFTSCTWYTRYGVAFGYPATS